MSKRKSAPHRVKTLEDQKSDSIKSQIASAGGFRKARKPSFSEISF